MLSVVTKTLLDREEKASESSDVWRLCWFLATFVPLDKVQPQLQYDVIISSRAVVYTAQSSLEVVDYLYDLEHVGTWRVSRSDEVSFESRRNSDRSIIKGRYSSSHH